MRGWGHCPNSSVKVTHISKQCFVLGWLDGGLLAGDQDGEWEWELSNVPDSCGSFALCSGTSAWPSIWRLAPDVSSTMSLDLAAMDTKLVAVNWNFGFSHLIWSQRPWQEIKQTTWFELAASLSHCFGTLFICHQWGSLSDVGMPPTWEKGSHVPPGTTKLGNLRDSGNSATAPTAKPDLGFSSSMLGEYWSVEPTQGCQKCDRCCTGTLDGLVGSHTRLVIYPALTICCRRVVICASLDTGFKGMQVVTCPANIKQLKSYWLKGPQKGLGTCTWINKTHSSFWLCSALQETPR